MTRWLVVGGGAAGCVFASRLSENPDHDVILLEAGPDHDPPPAEFDTGPYLADRGRLLPGSFAEMQPGRSPVEYLQGYGLGGSSLIFGGVAVPDPADSAVAHLMPTEPPWSPGAVGAAVCSVTDDAQPVELLRINRHRLSSADAYLRPFLDRSNLHVETNARAGHLTLDDRTVTGVTTADGREFVADVVVCCAGAIRTPELLLRSGVAVSGIGQGLQDHPAAVITLELFPEAVDPSAPGIAVNLARQYHQIMVVNHLPGAAHLGALMPGLMVVRSRGQVTVPDPVGPPTVQLNHLADPTDLDRMVAAVAEALELLDHPRLRAVVRAAHIDSSGTPASALADRAAIRKWLPDHLGGYHHVTSTCAMGDVTDRFGAVDGYRGLVVGDASLFATVPPINPFMSVVTQAERMARHWAARP